MKMIVKNNLTNLVDKLIEQAMFTWKQPGGALSVQFGHECIAKGFGKRSVISDQCVDENTIFALASCSKPFAVVATLLLEQQGKLKIDDKVIQYLPDFTLSDKMVTETVTLRDLMCNRLGLLPSEGRHRQVAVNRKDLLARMEFQPFRHGFRSSYGYCTDAFTILGEVLEQASGLSLDRLLDTLIFSPLEMSRTGLSFRRAKASENYASPHLWLNQFPQSIPWYYEEQVAAPAGGINSTAQDMLKWLRFLLDGKGPSGEVILPKSKLFEAHKLHTYDQGEYADREFSCVLGEKVESEGYGLGWYMHMYRNHQIIFHTGSIDGFRTITGCIPSHNFAASILLNADNPLLPRMLFHSLVDWILTKGNNNTDWNEIFYQYQINHSGVKQLTCPSHRDLTMSNFKLMQDLVGDYLDDTGFGYGKICQKGKRFNLVVGELEFELCLLPKESTNTTVKLAAFKAWPYSTGAQFTCDVEHKDGKVCGFSTSQHANFKRINTNSTVMF